MIVTITISRTCREHKDCFDGVADYRNINACSTEVEKLIDGIVGTVYAALAWQNSPPRTVSFILSDGATLGRAPVGGGK